MGDTDEFRYSALSIDGLQRAGVMDSNGFLPDGAPSHRLAYFCVENAGAAAHQVAAGARTM
jgi:predicted enzyme related to lactoylglutathione lyase